MDQVSTRKSGFGFWKCCKEMGLRLFFILPQVEHAKSTETLKNQPTFKNLGKNEENPTSICIEPIFCGYQKSNSMYTRSVAKKSCTKNNNQHFL